MQGEKHSIKGWAKNDQPREKLLRKTPESLSDSELLAILIQSGTPESSAVELGEKVLKKVQHNLQKLSKVTVRDLMEIKGIGEAKAIIIVAALELGRRRQAILPVHRILVKSSREVVHYLQAALRNLRHEVFAVLYLNSAGKILHFGIISQGGITGTIVDPRLIFKKALEEEAVSLILCHNHPSGSLIPSKADKELTAKIKEGAAYFDIKVLDHIIVSEEGHFSFADEGIL